MKLVASLIVRNEYGRYLPACLASLSTFCDEIRVLDDGSTDGWADRLVAHPIDLDHIHVMRSERSLFFDHEGAARDALLAWTMEAEPTHILAVDADELVTDGAAVRQRVVRNERVPAWSLQMEEVWRAEDECLCVRYDGHWRPHPVPILYRVPNGWRDEPTWRMRDQALASGRTPLWVGQQGRIVKTGVPVLHFGWANESERQQRYQRYVDHDGGKFHQGRHLDSIMWPDDRVTLRGRPWPASFDRAFMLDRANNRKES